MADILIIEDDLKLRTQIETYLVSRQFEIQSAADGQEGLDLLASIGCDAIVLDIKLPGISGIEVLKKIATAYPIHPPIIIITGHGDKSLAIESLRFGAFDFIEKPFHPQLLVDTVLRACELRSSDIKRFRSHVTMVTNRDLTQREAAVADLAASGLSNEQIASRLNVSAETVKSHMKNIFKKLGVENRTSLSSCLKNKA